MIVDKSILENAGSLGKCWAAVRDSTVIMTIRMKVPSDVDFENFRLKSIEMLKCLGEIKVGELFESEGEQYFLARPHGHKNRNKNKPRVEIPVLKIHKPKPATIPSKNLLETA